MKMTIKDFFESKEDLAIHTPTKEQATKLLKAFHEQGYKWAEGGSYLYSNYWLAFKENTIYGNNGTYGSIELNGKDFVMLQFEDIIFEEDDEKPMKNYIEEVAKLLGVEIGDEFEVVNENGDIREYSPYHFTKESLIDWDGDCDYGTLGLILTGKAGIKKDIVDWSKVEVDTIIEVSNGGYWVLRRFAEYKDGKVYCFSNGHSSKETLIRENWTHARLLEREQY